MMKFYRQLSVELTYPIMKLAVVTTQFGLLMNPPHMCDPKYRSDT